MRSYRQSWTARDRTSPSVTPASASRHREGRAPRRAWEVSARGGIPLGTQRSRYRHSRHFQLAPSASFRTLATTSIGSRPATHRGTDRGCIAGETRDVAPGKLPLVMATVMAVEGDRPAARRTRHRAVRQRTRSTASRDRFPRSRSDGRRRSSRRPERRPHRRGHAAANSRVSAAPSARDPAAAREQALVPGRMPRPLSTDATRRCSTQPVTPHPARSRQRQGRQGP